MVGLNSHGLRPQDIAMMRELGATDVRHTLYWHIWEADADYRVWFPAVLQDAHDAGLRVLLVVWGHDPAGHDEHSLARFAVWFERVVPALTVEAVQPWNEIDGDHFTPLFHAPTQRERGRIYGAHLRELRERVPHTYVAAGVDVGSAPEFWEGMRDVGVVPDAYAVHIYSPPFRYAVPRLWTIASLASWGLPVWLTEFGIDINLSSEEEQAAVWQEVELHSRDRFARIYGYALWTDEAQEGHGIVRPDGTHRPAAYWLRQHQRWW
jgi:hypothetical protein